MLLTVLLMSCSIGGEGPATPGSPAAEELAAVEQLHMQAAEIEELSGDLEGLTDNARASAEGPEREAVIAQMRAVMAEISEKNAALQADVAALEGRLHEAAGDPLLDATED